MDNTQTWAEALNISPESLNEWSSQVPEGKPLLVWCLEQGHVAVSDYMLWATERFGLAVLSSSFFGPEGLNGEFLAQQRAAGSWSAWEFPVDQWDGVTFVACVEPPAEAAPDTCYVLADPRAMLEAWELSGGATGEAGAEEEKIDAPAGINLETKTFTLNFDPDAVMGKAGGKGGHASSPAAPAAPAKKPAPREETVVGDIGSNETTQMTKGLLNLDDSFTKTNMNASIHLSRPADTVKTPPAPAAAKAPGMPIPPAAPAAAGKAAGASAPPPAAPTVKLNIPTTPVAPAAAASMKPAAPGASAKPATPAASATKPAAPAAAAGAKPSAPPAPTSTKTVLKAVESVVEEAVADEHTDADAEGTVIDATDLSAKTLLTRFASPTERLNLPPNESMALQKAFAYINKTYKGSCVLRIKDGVARFYKSDGTLPGDASTVHLDLEEPSFMRIVLKTGLSYHGYIVDSPVHRQFFMALTGEEMPKCVTAVPLKVGNKMWGILLAVGNDDLQNLETLSMIEGTAVQLLTALQSTWAKAA